MTGEAAALVAAFDTVLESVQVHSAIRMMGDRRMIDADALPSGGGVHASCRAYPMADGDVREMLGVGDWRAVSVGWAANQSVMWDSRRLGRGC